MFLVEILVSVDEVVSNFLCSMGVLLGKLIWTALVFVVSVFLWSVFVVMVLAGMLVLPTLLLMYVVLMLLWTMFVARVLVDTLMLPTVMLVSVVSVLVSWWSVPGTYGCLFAFLLVSRVGLPVVLLACLSAYFVWFSFSAPVHASFSCHHLFLAKILYAPALSVWH